MIFEVSNRGQAVYGVSCEAADGFGDDEIDLLKEDVFVKFIEAQDFINGFLKMIFSQTLAGMIFLVSAVPVGVFMSVCHSCGLLPVIAAAVFTADFCSKTGYVISFEWMTFPVF